MEDKLRGLEQRFRKQQRQRLEAEQKLRGARAGQAARNWDDWVLPQEWHERRKTQSKEQKP